MDSAAAKKYLKEHGIRFLRLQFTDIMGLCKTVEVPVTQFGKALSGNILFDGSALEGSARLLEHDMLLKPDLSTLKTFPWEERGARIARVICDTQTLEGKPFDGCPRAVLRGVVEKAKSMGYETAVGSEVEFFIFERDATGRPTTRSKDAGGYFDSAPIERGEEIRRAIIEALVALEFSVEASHHEIAIGQHEIDFRHTDALEAADNLVTFKFVARKIAASFGAHVTFMPKPVFGISGSGLHLHLSLSAKGKNAFMSPKSEHGISEEATHFIAGILDRARGMTAITNPLVNSYKRLVRGYEAPTHIAWSARNQSPLCRVPARRGSSTRVEYRAPDPACNPYLTMSVILAAGLHGIETKMQLGPPVNKNIFKMSARERGRLKVGTLPANLADALTYMERDRHVREVVGDRIYHQFHIAKLNEWEEYISQVHQWELEHYLAKF